MSYEIEEKWEQSGLLEGSVSKHSLAHILDATSGALRQIVDNPEVERSHAKYIAITSFPVITRALRNLKFAVNQQADEKCAVVFINEVETEEEMIKECDRAGSELYNFFAEQQGLNLSHIRISKFEKGYHLGLDFNFLN